MPLTYSQYVTEMALLAPTQVTDPNFQALIPGMLDYAELRLQRDLDLVDSTVTDASSTFTTGTRIFNLPSTNGTFINVDQINVITPSGTTNPETGTRNPMTPGSMDLLNALYPNSTGSTVPVYFTMRDQDTMLVGPFPDQAYTVEVVGTQRFTPLYISQTTSPLSVFFPDLLITASMVFLTGYQQNFGAAGVDNPNQGVNWESNYQAQLKSALTEEDKKMYLISKNANAGAKSG